MIHTSTEDRVIYPFLAQYRNRIVAALLLVLVSLPLTPTGPSHAVSPDVVTNQVHASGLDESSPFPYDFVELFDPTAEDVIVDGWSIQYASATGSNWTIVELGGVVPAGGHYLVRGSGRWDDDGVFPRPDAIGKLNLSMGSGKVALMVPSITLGCGASPGDCLRDDGIRDFVGYGGQATTAEGGQPAPSPGQGMAIQRAAGADRRSTTSW